MKEYIAEKVKILKQLGIWREIPKCDKQKLKASKNEIQADNWMTTFRHKYI